MLIERRKLLHERTGWRWSRSSRAVRRSSGRARASLRPQRKSPKAVQYLRRAGKPGIRALSLLGRPNPAEQGTRTAQGTARRHATRARRDRLADRSGFFVIRDGAPGGSEREAAYVRAREMSERLGDKTKLIEALTFLSNVRVNRAELQPARDLAEQAVAMAELVENPRIVARAHYQLGQVFFYQGAYAASREHLEQAHELFGPGPYRNFFDAWYARWNAYYLVLVAAVSGYPDTALKRSSEALSAARRSY